MRGRKRRPSRLNVSSGSWSRISDQGFESPLWSELEKLRQMFESPFLATSGRPARRELRRLSLQHRKFEKRISGIGAAQRPFAKDCIFPATSGA